MRKFHRWLSVLFGVLFLFIAATGLLSHYAALWPVDETSAAAVNPLIPAARAHGDEAMVVPPGIAAPVATAAPAAAFVCPETMNCRPKPPTTGPRAWVGFFHHLHSGEEFGPVGTALSIASGFALLFFAFSGLWMYVQMFNRRARRASHPKRIFW